VRRFGEALARPQIERHSGPAPVLDEELEGGERLGRRRGRNLRLIAVARRRLAVEGAWSVLAAYGVCQDLLGRHRADRLEDLDLLVANGVGVE